MPHSTDQVNRTAAVEAKAKTPTWHERRDRCLAGEPVLANLHADSGDRELIAWAKTEGRLVNISREGRTPDLGNPFKQAKRGHLTIAERHQLCDQHVGWLDGSVDLLGVKDADKLDRDAVLAAIPDLGGKVLACWCYPKRCHGDELIRRWKQGSTQDQAQATMAAAREEAAAIREMGVPLEEDAPLPAAAGDGGAAAAAKEVEAQPATGPVTGIPWSQLRRPSIDAVDVEAARERLERLYRSDDPTLIPEDFYAVDLHDLLSVEEDIRFLVAMHAAETRQEGGAPILVDPWQVTNFLQALGVTEEDPVQGGIQPCRPLLFALYGDDVPNFQTPQLDEVAEGMARFLADPGNAGKTQCGIGVILAELKPEPKEWEDKGKKAWGARNAHIAGSRVIEIDIDAPDVPLLHIVKALMAGVTLADGLVIKPKVITASGNRGAHAFIVCSELIPAGRLKAIKQAIYEAYRKQVPAFATAKVVDRALSKLAAVIRVGGTWNIGGGRRSQVLWAWGIAHSLADLEALLPAESEKAEGVLKLAKKPKQGSPAHNRQVIEDCLDVLDPSDYDEWIHAGIGIISTFPNDEGLGMWETWSRTTTDAAQQEEWAAGKNSCAEKWMTQIKPEGSGLGTLVRFTNELYPGRRKTVEWTDSEKDRETRKEQIEEAYTVLVEACIARDETGVDEATSTLFKFGIPRDRIDAEKARRWAVLRDVTIPGAGLPPEAWMLQDDEDDEDGESLQQDLPGLVLKHGLHVVVADAGAGKTKLALELAKTLSLGGLGFLDQETPRTGPPGVRKVLFIATDGGALAGEILKAYNRDSVLTGAQIEVWCARTATADRPATSAWSLALPDLDRLHQRLAKGDIAYVFIDTANAVFQQAGISPYTGPVDTYLRLLEGIVCPHATLFILTHTNRSGRGMKGIGGHPAWQEVPDVIFSIERLADEPADSTKRRFTMLKFRSEPGRSFVYLLEHGSFIITEGAMHLNIEDNLLQDILRRREEGLPTGPSELMPKQSNRVSVHSALNRLRLKRFIKTKGKGNHVTPAGLAHLETLQSSEEDQPVE